MPDPTHHPDSRKRPLRRLRRRRRTLGVVASLIETRSLNAIDPETYLADTIIKIVKEHPQSQFVELLPWNYAA